MATSNLSGQRGRDVYEFHRAFGVPIEPFPTIDVAPWVIPLREKLLREELGEYVDAVSAGDLVEVADGLADLVYVAYGTALSFGIDLDMVLDEVHRSNMSKLKADGTPLVRADGKVLKSDLYRPPNIAATLVMQPPLLERSELIVHRAVAASGLERHDVEQIIEAVRPTVVAAITTHLRTVVTRLGGDRTTRRVRRQLMRALRTVDIENGVSHRVAWRSPVPPVANGALIERACSAYLDGLGEDLRFLDDDDRALAAQTVAKIVSAYADEVVIRLRPIVLQLDPVTAAAVSAAENTLLSILACR